MNWIGSFVTGHRRPFPSNCLFIRNSYILFFDMLHSPNTGFLCSILRASYVCDSSHTTSEQRVRKGSSKQRNKVLFLGQSRGSLVGYSILFEAKTKFSLNRGCKWVLMYREKNRYLHEKQNHKYFTIGRLSLLQGKISVCMF